MTITVYKEPAFDAELNENYTTEAAFTLAEDANTDDIMKMVVQASILEGYHEISLVKAMKNYVYDYLDNNDVPDWFNRGDDK